MRAKMRVAIRGATKKRDICPESTVEDMLDNRPPSEISDGSRDPPKRKAVYNSFGTLPRHRHLRNDAGRVARVPDKRTTVEPEPAEKTTRDGGNVRLF